MSIKVINTREPLAAHVARVGPLARVSPHVHVEIAALRERAIADVARIRLVSIVNLHVPLQVARPRETAIALATCVDGGQPIRSII